MNKTRFRKKLIEVSIPLDKINAASIREKSIRHGHPSTLHLWWARRPLAAARAVIFAQMVDDPSEYADALLQNEEKRQAAERELKIRMELWDARSDDETDWIRPTLHECCADLERERLFDIIEDLVQWENTTNQYVLEKARKEIWQSWRRACSDNAGHPEARRLFDCSNLPGFHDPFAGGGALPLEAQRLGLNASASDLNPVAVLINKAMIELPPKFAHTLPVNPDADHLRNWSGAEGLAEDICYYGAWMRRQAEKRVGDLYPPVTITKEMAEARADLQPYVGRDLKVIAWLWARTVASPNPAFRDIHVPLASSFVLSSKASKGAWVEPVIGRRGYRFKVRIGKPVDAQSADPGTTAGKRAGFKCLMSAGSTPIGYDYIRKEGKAGRIGTRLMAIVAEGDRERLYLDPIAEHENIARTARPSWKPDTQLPINPRNYNTPNYGLDTFGSLFTDRQLVALDAFAGLVTEARDEIRKRCAELSSFGSDREPHFAEAYANAVATYLGLAVSRSTNTINALTIWSKSRDQSVNLFSRQAVPMAWDFPEVNPFAGAAGDFAETTRSMAKTISNALTTPAFVTQSPAQDQAFSKDKVVSTDPPYYDNICYADLSDFFYVWLRRSLKNIIPDLFATLTAPKSEELVANTYRHKNREEADDFFLNGMKMVMARLSEQVHPAFPVTIYYAFKQSESRSADDIVSTGWEVFLEAVLASGFAIDGTWPIRTERPTGVKTNLNALASSIVLVCRPRSATAPAGTRREFLAALKAELPGALRLLQRANIAPVDLAQTAIGPGMAIYSRFSRVLNADGEAMSVRDALARINEVLDEVLASQEGDFDPDTRWAVTWFDQFGFDNGDYGHAEQLSKAKNTSVAELADDRNGGIVSARAGKVKLRRPTDLSEDWDPSTDTRLTVWEMVHHLIRRLGEGGEAAAAELVAKLGVKAEVARELAYRLYVICERKKRADEARSYNALVQSWPEITRLARDIAASASMGAAQAELAI